MMFSIMTMASSTTKPVEIVSAIRVRLFRLYPSMYITPNVPTSDSGTAMLGMIVAETFLRNRKMTMTTRPDGQHQLELHVRNGCANGVGAVGENADLNLFRQGRGELRQQRLDAVYNRDDVSARLPLNVHDHGWRLVHPRRLAHVLDIILHIGDIGELDGCAVTIGDYQGRVLRTRKQLVVSADLIGLLRFRRSFPWPDSRWRP